MILGSIRVRKEHPLVRRRGPDGAAQVMLAYGVPVVDRARLYDVGWAFSYDVVPPNWIDGWWTETYEPSAAGALVHKIYGRRWTHLATPRVTPAQVRAARERLARDNPVGHAKPTGSPYLHQLADRHGRSRITPTPCGSFL